MSNDDRPVFFCVFAAAAGEEYALVYDELPTLAMLRGCPAMTHGWELTGTRYAHWSFLALVAEYQRRKANDTLPSSTLVRAKKRA